MTCRLADMLFCVWECPQICYGLGLPKNCWGLRPEKPNGKELWRIRLCLRALMKRDVRHIRCEEPQFHATPMLALVAATEDELDKRVVKPLRHSEHARGISNKQTASHELRSIATDLLEMSSLHSQKGIFTSSPLLSPGFGRPGTGATLSRTKGLLNVERAS